MVTNQVILRKFLVIINLLLFFSFLSAQVNEIPEQFKGKVKSVFSKAYSPKTENGTTVTGNPEYSFEYNFKKFFDEKQNLVKQYNFGRDTNILSIIEYKTDPAKKTLTSKTLTDNGKIIKKTNCDCNENMISWFCTSLNLNSGEKDTTISKFDRSGRIINKAIKSSNPFLNQTFEYSYDNKNNITELKVFDLKKTLIEHYINIYNDKNQRIEETVNLIKDSIIKKNTFEYNDNGNIIKTQSFSAGGKPSNYWDFELIYDVVGNWTEMTIYKNNKPRMIVLRNFEYYK